MPLESAGPEILRAVLLRQTQPEADSLAAAAAAGLACQCDVADAADAAMDAAAAAVAHRDAPGVFEQRDAAGMAAYVAARPGGPFAGVAALAALATVSVVVATNTGWRPAAPAAVEAHVRSLARLRRWRALPDLRTPWPPGSPYEQWAMEGIAQCAADQLVSVRQPWLSEVLKVLAGRRSGASAVLPRGATSEDCMSGEEVGSQ